MVKNVKEYVKKLIDSWNSHDLHRIMKYYSDDCELQTPYIKKILKSESGKIKGKDKIKYFWQKCLELAPDLKLELIQIAEGVNTLAIYYKSVNNRKAIEIMFFNDKNEIEKVLLHYSD